MKLEMKKKNILLKNFYPLILRVAENANLKLVTARSGIGLRIKFFVFPFFYWLLNMKINANLPSWNLPECIKYKNIQSVEFYAIKFETTKMKHKVDTDIIILCVNDCSKSTTHFFLYMNFTRKQPWWQSFFFLFKLTNLSL